MEFKLKITEIIIRIGPSTGETIQTHPPITLRRTPEKLWQVVDEGGFERGLLVKEINLAYMIQNEIISKWGGTE